MAEGAVKQRLKEFIEYKKISVRQFCIEIGVSPAFVSNIVKSIQPDKIDSISKHFPELNTGWLLTGEGEMLKSDYSAENKDTPIRPDVKHFYYTEQGEKIDLYEAEKQAITDKLYKRLMEMYEAGKIYPGAVVDKMLAEKDRIIAEREKAIAELQRRIWELENKKP